MNMSSPHVKRSKRDSDGESTSPDSCTCTGHCLREQVKMVESIRAWDLTMQKLVDIVQAKPAKLALLSLVSLVEGAAYGTPIASILDDMLKCDLREDELCLCQTFSSFWQELHQSADKLVDERLLEAITTLAETKKDPCVQRRGMATADKIVSMCGDVILKPVKTVQVEEMCDIIEFLAEHGSIDATGATEMQRFLQCEKWMDDWLGFSRDAGHSHTSRLSSRAGSFARGSRRPSCSAFPTSYAWSRSFGSAVRCRVK